MRVSSIPISSSPQPTKYARLPAQAHSAQPPCVAPVFLPFGPQVFAQARARRLPVFLLIAGEISEAFRDPSIAAQLAERTVPVYLPIGMRPDVELLCQRASALFSGEGALPLCALLLDDARPFLAAPLPPAGYPLDPSRLFVWLAHADRRFVQNPSGLSAQAAQVFQALRAKPLQRPYSPGDAAHDLFRQLDAAEDKKHGGFGTAKSPLVCALRFLQHADENGNRPAHAALNRALDAMLASPICDPLDGLFFRAALTDSWQSFVPEKALGINALLAPILLCSGRRSEAVRLLDAVLNSFSLEGGALCAAISASRETYASTSAQVCAALGSEDGLRVCRLLGLLHRHAAAVPEPAPSRFSPVSTQGAVSAFGEEQTALYPRLRPPISPEDSAFLRRALAQLQRIRSARTAPRPAYPIISEHMMLAAAVLAGCGARLGESRYIQAAQSAVSFLAAQPPACAVPCPLPASALPVHSAHAQALCGAAAAYALALLTLGSGKDMQTYAQSGLRMLSCALHTFVRPDGLVMHTAKDPAAFFPRIPAVFDSELPSPAALLIHALRIAHRLNPQAGYGEACETIWNAAAPFAHAQPIACASLIDAMYAK